MLYNGRRTPLYACGLWSTLHTNTHTHTTMNEITVYNSCESVVWYKWYNVHWNTCHSQSHDSMKIKKEDLTRHKRISLHPVVSWNCELYALIAFVLLFAVNSSIYETACEFYSKNEWPRFFAQFLYFHLLLIAKLMCYSTYTYMELLSIESFASSR